MLPMHLFCGCMQVDGLTVVVEDIVGSTGLELKVDPGVPYVYAGFAGNASAWCPLHIISISYYPSRRCTSAVVSVHALLLLAPVFWVIPFSTPGMFSFVELCVQFLMM